MKWTMPVIGVGLTFAGGAMLMNNPFPAAGLLLAGFAAWVATGRLA